jgi:hypothetical protein
MVINFGLVFVATVVNFILGAMWYSPLMFGKWWAQIMGMDHLSKDELQKLQKSMGPFYGLQFILAFVSIAALAKLVWYLPDFGTYEIAAWMWLGFIVPIQIGSVIWGNTKKPFWAKQIFVMTTYQLVGIMISAAILSV